jgi:KAP-like P-loop domain-containing protein
VSAVPPPVLPAWLADRQAVDLRAGVEDGQAIEELVRAVLGYVFSDTVRTAAQRLTGAVTAADVVAQILTSHPEYGARLGHSVDLTRFQGDQADGFQWLRRVGDQVEPERVSVVDGRVVIAGLARMVSPLREQLSSNGFLAALEAELEERLGVPVDGIFRPLETVPTHTDNPAMIDELNRESLAKVMATRIRYVRQDEAKAAQAIGDARFRGGGFLVHLYGPWGSGKTSLLNFLRKELVNPTPEGAEQRQPERWVVVTFNAWRHQRLAPPWWWLMRVLYRDGLTELWRIDPPRALWLFLREQWWRWWRALLWLLLLGGLVLVTWQLDLLNAFGRGSPSLAKLGAYAAAAATFLASLATVWSVVRGAARWLFATSARGARAYIDNAQDPMQTVKRHFSDLIRWIGHPVAILIDDLDRCRGDYIVQLLEGIQTMFREEPVTFVVAADRDWLADSFTAEYGAFTSVGDEPARPLGYLFLEKTFQISVGVPQLSPEVRRLYWDRLISSDVSATNRPSLEQAREHAKTMFQGANSEVEVLSRLTREPGTTPEQRVARAEAAAIVLSTPGLERERERALKPFAPLLDPNPRAMKRLVNAYGIGRSVEVLNFQNLSGSRTSQQRRALWTILNLRWPLLGAWLATHPDDVQFVGGDQPPPKTMGPELQSLLTNPAVISVVRGEADGVKTKLDPAAIRDCL